MTDLGSTGWVLQQCRGYQRTWAGRWREHDFGGGAATCRAVDEQRLTLTVRRRHEWRSHRASPQGCLASPPLRGGCPCTAHHSNGPCGCVSRRGRTMQGGRCRQVQTQLQAGRGLISGAEARGWDKAPGVLPLARGEVARQPRQPARGRLTTKGKTRIQAGKGVVLDPRPRPSTWRGAGTKRQVWCFFSQSRQGGRSGTHSMKEQ